MISLILAMMSHYGFKLNFIGPMENIKITTPTDFLRFARDGPKCMRTSRYLDYDDEQDIRS